MDANSSAPGSGAAAGALGAGGAGAAAARGGAAAGAAPLVLLLLAFGGAGAAGAAGAGVSTTTALPRAWALRSAKAERLTGALAVVGVGGVGASSCCGLYERSMEGTPQVKVMCSSPSAAGISTVRFGTSSQRASLVSWL